MRVLGEYVKYQRDPVNNVALESLLQVALLRRAEVVVENNNIDVFDLRDRHEFAELPTADERRSLWSLPAHEDGFNGI